MLKGYDALLNLVLDDTKEFLKDPDDPYRLLDETRTLGLTVNRGTSVMLADRFITKTPKSLPVAFPSGRGKYCFADAGLNLAMAFGPYPRASWKTERPSSRRPCVRLLRKPAPA